MTVSAQTITATCGTTRLPVEDATVSLDEGRAPFARADLIVAAADLFELLDPRTDARVSVVLEQRFNGSQTAASLPPVPGATSAADLTAALAGQTAADLSYALAYPWNPVAVRPTQRVRLNLGVRSVTLGHRPGTLRVAATSDEARLVDYGLLSAIPVTPAGSTVLDAVRLALQYAVPGAALETSTGAQAVAPDALVWQPGISAWSYLQPITASAGLRLWCDIEGLWHLADPADVVAPGQATLSTSGTVTDAEDTISRDDAEWFDGVVITYRWTDSSNVQHVQHDVAGDLTSSRILHVEYARPYPGPGEATARLRKAQGRGRVLTVDAVSDFTVRPAQALSLTAPPTPVQTGYVSSVEWRLPADTMRVGSRALVDTPDTAWVFGPAGVSWTDMPVGMSWPEFEWSGV